MKRYFPLFALTLAFLAALTWLTLRGGAASEKDTYRVAVERSAPETDAPETAREPIDINAATAEELERLMGIGPVLAQAIVDYREANGPFASVDELLAVSGIGEAKLDGIRNDVTVGGEEEG